VSAETLLETLRQLTAELHPARQAPRASLDGRLEQDYGFDSLGRVELFLRIEILACEAWARLGRIPESALPKIRKATFDAAKIAEVEARVGHDVIAFLTVVNESIGQPEARYVHLGMTSQDLNDTAMAVQLVESSRIIAGDLGGVREAAAELFISEATVKTHLLHVYAKLGVKDRAAAVAVAYERGLLNPGTRPR